MIKKLTAGLVLPMLLALAACSGSYEEPGQFNTAPPPQTGIATPVPVEQTEVSENMGDWQPEEIPESPASDFTYIYDAVIDGVEITGYIGNSAVIRIPAEIDGDTVKIIANSAFSKDNHLVSGTGHAFIEQVIIPHGVTTIEKNAFRRATNLSSITIPDGVTSIGDDAFQGAGLANAIIPDSVTELGIGAFADCPNLRNAVIGNGITIIKEETFRNTRSMTSVTIGSSVTEIHGYVSGRVLGGAFINSGLTSVTIPNGVTFIGGNTFSGSANLTSVSIPNSVTEIGGGAFSDTGLTNVSIPGSVERIYDKAFMNCTKLASVKIEKGVIGILDEAFQGCTVLSNITLPDSLVSIGSRAFMNCVSLRSLEIPVSVNYIANNPFLNCRALTATHRGVAYNHNTFDELNRVINNQYS
ncbi:MAG: leucine-rich repeat domain-containing protein [Oscillospiraceae bacterium]|nr:leucine-rich repeat domain-containing protein [Oscillospiraceae bacterium]